MKLGSKVAVCQDGKLSRMVEGEVVATKNGYKIKVSFAYGYDEETTETVEAWFKVRPSVRYSQNKTRSKNFTVSRLKRYKSFAGWVDNEKWWMPWFTVYKWKKEYEQIVS